MRDSARLAVASLPTGNEVVELPRVSIEALEGVLGRMPGGVDLLLLPQYTVGEDDDPDAGSKHDLVRRFALEHRCYVAYGMSSGDGAEKGCVVRIVGRDGDLVGDYVKTHLIPGRDPLLKLGDDTPVWELDFGRVALLAGSDLLVPELAEVYAARGAEVLLAAMGTQPLRDDTETQRLLRARAIENYCYVAAATFASSDVMYMASNVEAFNLSDDRIDVSGDVDATFNAFGLGKHTGRAQIVDTRGEVLASTGREAGVAVSEVGLARKRDLARFNYGTGRLLSHQNRRGVFGHLATRTTYQPGPRSVTRPVVALCQLPYDNTCKERREGWHAEVLRSIEEAAARADIVVCSEYSRSDSGSIADDEALPDFMAGCSRIAREGRCYVAVNDVLDRRNTSLLFDRGGALLHRYRKVNTLNMMYKEQPPAGTEIETVDLDFGRVGFMICADSYCQEIPRILALKGAEVILLQSQSWGYDANAINEGMSRAWAIENCLYMVTCGFPSSQVAHRSSVIDPTGETVSATDYDRAAIHYATLDMEAVTDRVDFVFDEGGVRKDRTLRRRLMEARRPELYVDLL
jgi:predicted amidohydrolase